MYSVSAMLNAKCQIPKLGLVLVLVVVLVLDASSFSAAKRARLPRNRLALFILIVIDHPVVSESSSFRLPCVGIEDWVVRIMRERFTFQPRCPAKHCALP